MKCEKFALLVENQNRIKFNVMLSEIMSFQFSCREASTHQIHFNFTHAPRSISGPSYHWGRGEGVGGKSSKDICIHTRHVQGQNFKTFFFRHRE